MFFGYEIDETRFGPYSFLSHQGLDQRLRTLTKLARKHFHPFQGPRPCVAQDTQDTNDHGIRFSTAIRLVVDRAIEWDLRHSGRRRKLHNEVVFFDE